MQNAQIWTGLFQHSSGAPVALSVLSFYVQQWNLLGAAFLDCSLQSWQALHSEAERCTGPVCGTGLSEELD